MLSVLVVWLCLVTGSHAVPEKNSVKCLNYQQPVALQGKLQRVTFPGPPNYQSIADGDQPEVQWVVDLSTRLCVEKDKDNDGEKGLGTVQLVFPHPESDFDRYKVMLGRKVEISGELFHAQTGHHHTSVLIEVKSIKQIG